jgi:hypothetical protein
LTCRQSLDRIEELASLGRRWRQGTQPLDGDTFACPITAVSLAQIDQRGADVRNR